MRNKIGITFLIIATLMGCHSFQKKDHSEKKEQNTHKKYISKPEKDKKKTVDINKPVATFKRNMDDAATNNDFVVQIFPTTTANHYTVRIQYGQNRANDEEEFPPQKYIKHIAIHPGKTENECLLGFIDKKGKFNEKTLITGSKTQIKIKALKAYYFSTK